MELFPFGIDSIKILSIVAFTVTYALLVQILLKRMRVRREGQRGEFHETLLEGFKNGSLETIDDIVNIYKGISGLSSDDLSYRHGLSKQLRSFMVRVVSKKIDKELDDNAILEWKKRISEFIRINDEVSPYADLPPAERNILSDISSFIERNDIKSLKRKLLELSGMIQGRDDDLNRIRSMNKWSVPLSVIGMILTITFGLIAIF